MSPIEPVASGPVAAHAAKARAAAAPRSAAAAAPRSAAAAAGSSAAAPLFCMSLEQAEDALSSGAAEVDYDASLEISRIREACEPSCEAEAEVCWREDR